MNVTRFEQDWAAARKAASDRMERQLAREACWLFAFAVSASVAFGYIAGLWL